MSRFAWCLLSVALVSIWRAEPCFSQPGKPAAGEEIPGLPPAAATPFIISPPRYPEPVFVPAAQLLQRADQVMPVTDEGFIVTNRASAGYDQLIADPELRRYLEYDHPLRLRQYESQIRLAQAELEVWRQRIGEYTYFNKAGALFVDLQNAHLSWLSVQERLRNLRYERALYLRQHSHELYLRRQGLAAKHDIVVAH